MNSILHCQKRLFSWPHSTVKTLRLAAMLAAYSRVVAQKKTNGRKNPRPYTHLRSTDIFVQQNTSSVIEQSPCEFFWMSTGFFTCNLFAVTADNLYFIIDTNECV